MPLVGTSPTYVICVYTRLVGASERPTGVEPTLNKRKDMDRTDLCNLTADVGLGTVQPVVKSSSQG